jgi:hypothetical protein
MLIGSMMNAATSFPFSSASTRASDFAFSGGLI